MSLNSSAVPGIPQAAAIAGLFILVVVAIDAGAQGIALRLERTLSESAPGPLGEGTEILLRFGSSEIEQQIALTRERIARLEKTNRELARAITGGDELLSALRELEGLQDQTREGMSKAVAVQEEAAAAPADTMASVPVPAEPAAPAVTLPAATTAAPEPPAAVAPRGRVREPVTRSAPSFLGLPGWVPMAVAGLVAMVLLATFVRHLLRRRDRQAPATVPPGVAGGRPASQRAAAAAAPAGSSADGAATIDLDAPDTLDALESDLDLAPGEAPSPAAAEYRPPAESEERWSHTLVSRKAADPKALKEVDTLIAFEQYDKARAVLDEMLVTDPDNPELVLRHYHVRTQGDSETTDDDEALLRAMMDGPLSDTMLRVRELGRGLMPGDPLFDDPAKAAAASHVLKLSKLGEPAETDDDDNVVPFSSTLKLKRSPIAD